MNHQPFREWLLSEEKLSSEQAHALQEHLQTCPTCSQIETAWREVAAELRSTPMLIPIPGFDARWQAHLEVYQQRKTQQRVWISIGSASFIAVALFALLATQLWDLMQAPEPYIVAVVNRLVNLVPVFFSFQEIFEFFRGGSPVYTLLGSILLVGMISFMSVLWLATYRKFSLARRSI